MSETLLATTSTADAPSRGAPAAREPAPAGPGTVQAAAGIAQAGPGTVQAGAGIVQAGAGIAQAGAGIAQAGTGIAQARPGRAQAAGAQALPDPSLALAARGVTVRFGGLVAVDGVSLDVRPGELVGVIGPNGAGKTTFFHTLSGVLAPTEGRLFSAGGELTGQPAYRFAASGVARTFQTPRVFRELTALENVQFGLEHAGRHRPPAHGAFDDARAILAFLGLGAFGGTAAGALTPARQRLLEIGMALGTRPRVLLLDEVAAGLTEHEVESSAQMIRRLRSELGLAVVWIEHAVRVLMHSVERIVVLHQGRKMADGTPAEVARDPAVIEAYLGQEVS